jgi:nitrate/TMAO reductase-like tetraheme cytochrome c subunit
MAMTLKTFIDWCKRHILMVTLLAVASIVVFGFVNIQILHMTSEPEFCAMCHPKHGFGPLAEVDSWEHSGHSEAGVSCLDCHGRPGPVGYIKAKLGGLKDTYMQFTISREEKLEILSNPAEELVPMEHCLFCHSDEGNREYRENHSGPLEIVEMRLLDSVQNPEFRERKGLPDILTETFVGGTHFDHAFHIESFELTCRDCHFGVVHQPGTKTDRMNTCVACHSENTDSSAPQIGDCTVCHEAQLDMNEGRGAKGVTGEPGIMYAAEITCQMCHTGVEEGVYRPSSSTCTDCHDAGYVEIFIGWEKEINAKVERLNLMRANVEGALKKAEETHRDAGAGWKLYEKALYNLNFVKNDGTHGVHNNDYAQAILKSVEADFKQIQQDLKRKW